VGQPLSTSQLSALILGVAWQRVGDTGVITVV
jgi:hypothetical protein